MSTAQNVVAYFLDECGVDVNMTTPGSMETVLHVFARQIVPTSTREAVRMLKYLVEERGADATRRNVYGDDARDVALAHRNSICIEYFSSLPRADPVKLRRLEALERKRAEAMEAELTSGIREEQETKAKEAAAALLADLDAEK